MSSTFFRVEIEVARVLVRTAYIEPSAWNLECGTQKCKMRMLRLDTSID